VRDGRPYPPADPGDVELLPAVGAACDALRAAGYLLIVVTNQPDVARGRQTRSAVDAINQKLRELVSVDDVLVCPHDDADRCACRKPAPGLLLQAADRWDIDLADSVMVGDRWRDIEAGRRAGCRTVFLDRGYAEHRPRDPDLTAQELGEVVQWILAAPNP
jgi:D-glycero-D-manno-heptose 1,7-bisphosphate phosphatase